VAVRLTGLTAAPTGDMHPKAEFPAGSAPPPPPGLLTGLPPTAAAVAGLPAAGLPSAEAATVAPVRTMGTAIAAVPPKSDAARGLPERLRSEAAAPAPPQPPRGVPTMAAPAPGDAPT